ncbi:MAG: uroporphyrinogen-III synthase [Bowdeniella nasicola]|nr:uroporphyrinogen-III synthase [Bowdeniella nasicola]
MAAIRAAGGAVVATPLTRSQSLPVPTGELAAKLSGGDIDLVALTSARTIDHLPAALRHEIAANQLPVACVGPATAAAASAAGFHVTVTGTSDATALAAAIGSGSGRVWLPCSALAKPTLATQLRARGWHVNRTEVYTMTPVDQLDSDIVSAFHRGQFDALVITSGSVSRALVELVGHAGPGTALVTIGEPSARAVRAGGGIVAAIAPQPTPTGIVSALMEVLS